MLNPLPSPFLFTSGATSIQQHQWPCTVPSLRRNIEDTEHLGCRFPLIHWIHQRIYKACYLNAISYQNDNTIHEYSCTFSTYPDSNYVQSSTQKVNEEAIFHIIIVLSVIDRNKSMQYSSLAIIFLVSDLAPSLR